MDDGVNRVRRRPQERAAAAGRGEIRTLAALAAVALVGWYLLSPSGSEPPESAASAPGGVQVGRGTPGVSPGPAGAEGENARGDLARAIIEELRSQGRIDLDQVYERAERFRSIGLQADAYLLHFFAARQGHAPSALALGRMYDPKSFTREASILEGPDAAQAHRWYLAAARAGDAAAKRHLADLRARVERSASQGEDDARRLMLQWR